MRPIVTSPNNSFTGRLRRIAGSTPARRILMALIAFIILSLPSLARPITVTVNFGRPSRDCRGFGICGIVIDIPNNEHSASAKAMLQGNQLTMAFQQSSPDREEILVIEEPLTLDPQIAHELGASGLQILPGAYSMDYSTNPHGIVTVPVQRIGITIDIEVGRRRKGCTGFGICSITIGLGTDGSGSTERSVPTAATVNGDRLTLELLSEPVEHGTALVIDEDIVLDAKTSIALGSRRITIPHGTYPVDYSTNPHGTVTLPMNRFGITINVEVGRPSRRCRGLGICSITIGLGTDGSGSTERSASAIASLDHNELSLLFTSSLPEQGDMMTIDEDVVLDASVARMLGAQSVVVKPGEYQITDLGNGQHQVTLSVARIGITINIEVGRRSKGCTGFGICSITVGVDLNDNAASAIGTLNGNQLTVDLLSQPKEQGDVMMIDEPIVLDEQTARSLGSNALMILPGAYPVDYSGNPNGTVVLNVRRIGITINIDMGLPSRNCNSGLGICSITIGLSSTQRSVPTIASIEHGKLALLFTSELPEQGDVMTIEEDITLDAPVARMLGGRGVVIRKGDYTIERRADGMQYVELDVTQNAIGLTIYIGRSWGNCRGFGICRITVERDLSAQAIRAIATMTDGGLELEWLDEAPEQGSVLMIDEALTLDPAVAAALGLQGMEIAPGGYAVDYTGNPEGSVRLSLRSTETSGVDAGTSGRGTSGSLAMPNPTTGATTIQFQMHRAGTVTVVLSDATGRQVATLADAVHMEAGSRSVQFDATSLPQGTYFYSIRSAGNVEAGRVVVTH